MGGQSDTTSSVAKSSRRERQTKNGKEKQAQGPRRRRRSCGSMGRTARIRAPVRIKHCGGHSLRIKKSSIGGRSLHTSPKSRPLQVAKFAADDQLTLSQECGLLPHQARVQLKRVARKNTL